MNKVIVMLGAFLLIGCASKASYIKMHSQGSLSKSEVALLKPVAHILIDEIDSKETSISTSDGLGTIEHEIEFLPGDHQLKLRYNSGVQYSVLPIDINISLEANKKYIIKPELSKGGTWWKGHHYDWKPVLVDVTDKDECWTIGVGTTFGPKGC